MISLTCLSIILVTTGNIDIGLYPASELLLVPLGIGTTQASFHSLGKFPVEMDRLMSLDNNWATTNAVCFNILDDIPSQPVDLPYLLE